MGYAGIPFLLKSQNMLPWVRLVRHCNTWWRERDSMTFHVTTEYVSNGVQLASNYFGRTAHHLLRQPRAGVIVPCFSRLGHFSSFNLFI
jgi:hypothetical protein